MSSTPATPADPLGLIGTTLDQRYCVETLVEQTDWSFVYRAEHKVWHRPVAIKALNARGVTKEARGRMFDAFVREGALLSELSERCVAICQARDMAAVTTVRGDWVPYIVLEWLQGESLHNLLAHEIERGAPPHSVQEAIHRLDPVANALALAHDHGIVHRDVKPANIFLVDHTGPSRSKLLDFGIATIVSDFAAGADERRWRPFTPAYGAPEQFFPVHGATGPWTDVFGLALTMVELLTLRPALEGDSVRAFARQACDPSHRPTPQARGAHVADAFDHVMARALSVRPADRYCNAREFWGAVVQAQADPPSRSPDGQTTVPASFPRRAHRRRSGWWVSALALAAAYGALIAAQHWTRLAQLLAALPRP